MEAAFQNDGVGERLWVAGDHYTIKASGAETGGAFALFDVLVAPGGGPPPHVHHHFDERFYLLEGTLRFHQQGRAFAVGPHALVTVPRGTLFRFQNEGPSPARLLLLVNPAGLEEFFRAVGRPCSAGSSAGGSPTPEELQNLLETAPRFGIEIRPLESV